MDERAARNAMDRHIGSVLALATEHSVSKWKAVDGPHENVRDLGSCEAAEHFLRAMLYEGFCCSAVVQRQWMRSALILVIWDQLDGEPALNGPQERILVWRGVDASRAE